MSRTDRSRPTRVIRLIDGHDTDGNPILVDYTQEYGRRAGLHSGKSQTAYHRTVSNRRDRQDARRQLARDPESVSNRARRNDSVWLAR